MPRWDLAATALVLVAEAAAALIADDADGGNSGVTIVSSAPLVAGVGYLINSILFLYVVNMIFLWVHRQ